MGHEWSDTDAAKYYKNLNFDSSAFDKAIKTTKESFDSTIQEAGMQAGMASGQGLNPGRVTADTYTKGMSARDSTVANVEMQKAGAKSQFDMSKQRQEANAMMDFEKNKPGFWDYAQGVLGVGTSIASTIMTGGIAAPSIAGSVAGLAGKFNYKGPGVGGGVNNKSVPVIETNPNKDTQFNLGTTKMDNTYDWGLFSKKKKGLGSLNEPMFNF